MYSCNTQPCNPTKIVKKQLRLVFVVMDAWINYIHWSGILRGDHSQAKRICGHSTSGIVERDFFMYH